MIKSTINNYDRFGALNFTFVQCQPQCDVLSTHYSAPWSLYSHYKRPISVWAFEIVLPETCSSALTRDSPGGKNPEIVGGAVV